MSVTSVELSGEQVRTREGTLVRLALVQDLTTENVIQGDRVEFEVVDNIIVENYVVIPKGAVAWGSVIKVKGAGKRNAKDASVTFRLVGVRAADGQNLPLRLLPHGSKKTDVAENDIVESLPIPRLRERIIGAEKGKQYAAYTASDVVVDAPESTPAPAAEHAPVRPPTPAAVAPANPPQALPAPEPAAIVFKSEPSGADILINGKVVGSTPSSLSVAPGMHDVEIRVPTYVSWKRRMKVTPGSHPTIQARLKKE